MREGDLHGACVNLAARVCDAADSGQALATRLVRDLTVGKGFSWAPGQDLDAKGFEQPVRVYALESI